ncbi:MAG: hypothetical protein AMXMBFR34_40150 [Myxococcaceae bacterium]
MSALRLVGGVLLLSASFAWADLPPPDVSGCGSLPLGASCKRDDGSPGTCAKATCTRNDYSEGPPPKTVSYDCVRCTEGAAPVPPEVDAGAGEAKKSSCAAVPGGALVALAGWLLARRTRR